MYRLCICFLNSPSIDLKIKTGGSDTSGKSSTPAVHQVALANISVSLPIYTGGQIKYGIESARYLAEAKILDAEFNKAGIVQNTLNACRNLYKATQTVSLVQENLKQKNKNG